MTPYFRVFVWLAILAAAMLYGAVHAAPVCYHDDANGSGDASIKAYFEPGSLLFPDGGCVVWHCDVNHKWVASGFCFTPSDAAQYSVDTVRSWLGLSRDARNQLWANNVKPAQPGTIEERMIAWRDSLPKPDKAPPSGLVTTSTKAYRMNRIYNGTPTFTLVGTVALGAPCAPESLNGYHRIDIAVVKFPAAVLKPLEVFGACDP